MFEAGNSREDGGFGVGEMPAEVARFNWGAFALPLFWAIAYGAWPITGLWLLSLAAPLFLSAVLGIDPTHGPVQALLGVSAVSEIFNGIVRLWAGANGNAVAWKREQLRLKLVETAEPRFAISRFLSRQRIWRIAGLVILMAALVGTVYLNAAAWSTYGLTVYGAIEPVLWLGAEFALGVYLARSMTGPSDSAPASEGL